MVTAVLRAYCKWVSRASGKADVVFTSGATMKKLLVASIALTALIAGSATAAELARPVYKRPVVVAVPPPVSNWTGLYVGVHGGWGWTSNSTATSAMNLSSTVSSGLAPPSSFSFDSDSSIVGLQIGYNYQFAS